MAIGQEIYTIFEDIVGSENISDEPAILDSYAYQWGAELFTNTSFLPRSGAVLLPQNTEEIQSIVRACNKHKIRYKAFSTGWGFYSALGIDEDGIQIDLRRMNQIIEINEKNMYAVVEPYVTCAQLQGELMQRGLNCNVIGAGCNTSAMPIVAHQGLGHSAVSTSYGDRNVLGVEWVLPDGELLKLGALGGGSGWFCGDGPGPSLRGVLRGPQTVMGGLGIFSKAATKVYHWPGPAKPQLEGISPYYRLSEFPRNFRLHYPFFPDYDKFRDAIMTIAESEIAFLVDRIPTQMLAQALSGNNDEGEELLNQFLSETKGCPGFVVALSADSNEEIEYKEKVFQKIIEEQSGKLLSYIERDEVKREYLWTETRVTMAVREVFRATGRFLGTLGDSALFQNSLKHMISTFGIKEEYQKKKLFRADDGSPDCMWGIPIEGGHTGHCENLVQVHPTGESWKALMEFSGRCEDLAIQEKIGTPVTVWGDAGHDKFGPHLCNYHDWLRKLKKAYDPNGVSGSAMYISAKTKE